MNWSYEEICNVPFGMTLVEKKENPLVYFNNPYCFSGFFSFTNQAFSIDSFIKKGEYCLELLIKMKISEKWFLHQVYSFSKFIKKVKKTLIKLYMRLSNFEKNVIVLRDVKFNIKRGKYGRIIEIDFLFKADGFPSDMFHFETIGFPVQFSYNYTSFFSDFKEIFLKDFFFTLKKACNTL